METFSEMKTTELLDSGIVSRWECLKLSYCVDIEAMLCRTVAKLHQVLLKRAYFSNHAHPNTPHPSLLTMNERRVIAVHF